MRKKILSTALCAAMVLAPATVFADPITTDTGSGDSTGTGTNEGLVDTDIYSVTLPTVAENTYDFYLDPQSNIDDTSAERYSNFTPTNTTNAYFKTTSSTLTAKSASATVTNASYKDLDVTVKVEVTGNDHIDIEAAGTITNDTPTMFMGLESEVKEDDSNSGSLPGSGTTDVAYVSSSGTLEKKFTLKGDAKDYEKSWDSSGNKYVMANTGSAHANSELAFNLVVGCNTTDDADWTTVPADEAPTVKVTWSYGKQDTVEDTSNYKNAMVTWATDYSYLVLSETATKGFENISSVELSKDGKTYNSITYTNTDGFVVIQTNDLNTALAGHSGDWTAKIVTDTDTYIYSTAE